MKSDIVTGIVNIFELVPNLEGLKSSIVHCHGRVYSLYSTLATPGLVRSYYGSNYIRVSTNGSNYIQVRIKLGVPKVEYSTLPQPGIVTILRVQ